MTQAIRRDYTIRRGDAWAGETFRLISTVGASSFTNALVKCQIRTKPDATVVKTFTITGTVTTEGTNGVLTFALNMTATESAAIAAGAYLGDIEVTADGFPTSTIIAFRLTVVPDITHA